MLARSSLSQAISKGRSSRARLGKAVEKDGTKQIDQTLEKLDALATAAA